MSASMVYYVVSGMSYIPPSAERRREWMIVDAELGEALRKGWSMPPCLRLWSHSHMEVGHVQAEGFLSPPRDPSCPFPFLVAKAVTEIALDK